MTAKPLLPPNATSHELALSLSMARLAAMPPKCREMWDTDTCPPSHLPWLAWALSVDEWRADWTDSQKRAVIAASFTVHQHKGTIGAVRDALGSLGYEIEVVEWFNEAPAAEPYTFGLTAEMDIRGIAPGLWDELEAVALATKNVRSHLRYIRLRATIRGAFYVGGTTLSAETVEIQPYSLTEIESRGAFYIGAALIVTETVEIFPAGVAVLTLTDGMPLLLTDGAGLRLTH